MELSPSGRSVTFPGNRVKMGNRRGGFLAAPLTTPRNTARVRFAVVPSGTA